MSGSKPASTAASSSSSSVSALAPAPAPAARPPTNYAAVASAAKSRAAAAKPATPVSAGNKPAASASSAATPSATPSATTPTASSTSSPAPKPAPAVSLPKAPAHARKNTGSVNFGSLHDKPAVPPAGASAPAPTSAPAAAPANGSKPAQFGTVAPVDASAANKVQGKGVVFGPSAPPASGKPAHGPHKTLDFQKMFQSKSAAKTEQPAAATPAPAESTPATSAAATPAPAAPAATAAAAAAASPVPAPTAAGATPTPARPADATNVAPSKRPAHNPTTSPTMRGSRGPPHHAQNFNPQAMSPAPYGSYGYQPAPGQAGAVRSPHTLPMGPSFYPPPMGYNQPNFPPTFFWNGSYGAPSPDVASGSPVQAAAMASPHPAPAGRMPGHAHHASASAPRAGFGSPQPSAAAFVPVRAAGETGLDVHAQEFTLPSKRTAAVKIVNPNTKQEVQFHKSNTPASPAPNAAPLAPATSSPAPAAAPSPVPAPAKPAAPASEKQHVFLAQILEAKAQKEAREKAKLEAEEKAKLEAEAKAKKEAEEKAAAEAKAKAEAEEKAKKEAEEKAKKEAEEKAKKEAEEKAKKEAEEKAKKEAEEKAKKEAEEKAAAEAEAKAKAEEEEKAKKEAEEKAKAAEAENDAAPKEEGTPTKPVSPSLSIPRTPGLAGLPAKPLASPTTPSAAKFDAAEADKRRRDSALPTSPVPETPATPTAAGSSSSTSALRSLEQAQKITDLSKVQYPEKVNAPDASLTSASDSQRFRYDRDFLLQFMNVFKERPAGLPPPEAIGMAPAGGAAGGRGGRGFGFGGGSGRSFGGVGLGGMGSLSKGGVAKSSEERFAQSQRSVVGGAMGNFNLARGSGMSRGGSGSNALPSRDSMGRTTSGRGSRRGRPLPPEKGGVTLLPSEIKPIEHTENRWIPQSMKKKENVDDALVTARKVKALLNKLTLDNFASVSTRILEWADKSKDETDAHTLDQVIELIFEKATDEPNFSQTYTQLCAMLQSSLSPEVKLVVDAQADRPQHEVAGGMLFRRLLLRRCQTVFEANWAHLQASRQAAKAKEPGDSAAQAAAEAELESEEKAAEAALEERERLRKLKEAAVLSDEYYEAQKAKRRSLGLLQFIGELYNADMLRFNVVLHCMTTLVQKIDEPEEEDVESITKLCTAAGPKLDATLNPKTISRGEENSDRAKTILGGMSKLAVCYERIKEMSEVPGLPSRMRYMLVDLLQLRARGWHGKGQSQGPKTIREIHADAARKKVEAEAAQHARPRHGGGGSHMGGPMSRGGSRRGQNRFSENPDGWQTTAALPDVSRFGEGIRSAGPRSTPGRPDSVFSRRPKAKAPSDGTSTPTRTASSNAFAALADAEEQSAQAERPKLQLQPRTKPLPGDDGKEEEGGKPAEMSEEDAAKKIKMNIDEFLSVRDADEGAASIESLPPQWRAKFISDLTEKVVDRKEDVVKATGRLYGALVDKKLIDFNTLDEGFSHTLEFAVDIESDVPRLYEFLAILLVGAHLSREEIAKIGETRIKGPDDPDLPEEDRQYEAESALKKFLKKVDQTLEAQA